MYYLILEKRKEETYIYLVYTCVQVPVQSDSGQWDPVCATAHTWVLPSDVTLPVISISAFRGVTYSK